MIPLPSISRQKGNIGEDFAARYLEKNGYKILERNYTTKMGEIDIIAQKDQIIAFIEVKARAEGCMYSPGEAVTFSKQRKICKTAILYKLRKKFIGQPRFDVFEITFDKSTLEIRKYNHIINAFGTESLHGYF